MKPETTFNSLPFAARCVIVMFGAAGFAAALIAIASQPAFAPGRLLVLLVVAALSARAKVNLFKGSTISFLTFVVLLAVINEGPAVAMLLAICGVTIQTLFPSRRVVVHQLAFNTGMIALTVTATWWTHHLLASTQAMDAISSEMTATILASFMYFLGNSISVSLIVGLTKGMSIFSVWSNHFLYSAPSFLIAGLLSLGLIALAATQSFFLVAALITVIFLAYYCSIRLTAQPATRI